MGARSARTGSTLGAEQAKQETNLARAKQITAADIQSSSESPTGQNPLSEQEPPALGMNATSAKTSSRQEADDNGDKFWGPTTREVAEGLQGLADNGEDADTTWAALLRLLENWTEPAGPPTANQPAETRRQRGKRDEALSKARSAEKQIQKAAREAEEMARRAERKTGKQLEKKAIEAAKREQSAADKTTAVIKIIMTRMAAAGASTARPPNEKAKTPTAENDAAEATQRKMDMGIERLGAEEAQDAATADGEGPAAEAATPAAKLHPKDARDHMERAQWVKTGLSGLGAPTTQEVASQLESLADSDDPPATTWEKFKSLMADWTARVLSVTLVGKTETRSQRERKKASRAGAKQRQDRKKARRANKRQNQKDRKKRQELGPPTTQEVAERLGALAGSDGTIATIWENIKGLMREWNARVPLATGGERTATRCQREKRKVRRAGKKMRQSTRKTRRAGKKRRQNGKIRPQVSKHNDPPSKGAHDREHVGIDEKAGHSKHENPATEDKDGNPPDEGPVNGGHVNEAETTALKENEDTDEAKLEALLKQSETTELALEKAMEEWQRAETATKERKDAPLAGPSDESRQQRATTVLRLMHEAKVRHGVVEELLKNFMTPKWRSMEDNIDDQAKLYMDATEDGNEVTAQEALMSLLMATKRARFWIQKWKRTDAARMAQRNVAAAVTLFKQNTRETDKEAAQQLLQATEDAANPEAEYMLGLLAQGERGDLQKINARSWLERAAGKGLGLACVKLWKLDGSDPTNGRWMTPALLRNSPAAQYSRGKALMKAKEHDEALKMLQTAAESKHPRAAEAIGDAMAHGLGTEDGQIDMEQAGLWYQLAVLYTKELSTAQAGQPTSLKNKLREARGKLPKRSQAEDSEGNARNRCAINAYAIAASGILWPEVPDHDGDKPEPRRNLGEAPPSQPSWRMHLDWTWTQKEKSTMSG